MAIEVREIEMGLLKKLYDWMDRAALLRANVIEAPTIGFLNWRGAASEADVADDQAAISPAFTSCCVSTDDVPSCSVLFVYADFTETGAIIGRSEHLLELSTAAGAKLVVIASPSIAEHYVADVDRQRRWPGNYILTTDRGGSSFSTFFAKLFGRMANGSTMLMVWNDIAPFSLGAAHSGAPATIGRMGIGNIGFKRRA